MTTWTVRVLTEDTNGRNWVARANVEAHTQLSAESFALADVLNVQHLDPIEVLSVKRHPSVPRH